MWSGAVTLWTIWTLASGERDRLTLKLFGTTLIAVEVLVLGSLA